MNRENILGIFAKTSSGLKMEVIASESTSVTSWQIAVIYELATRWLSQICSTFAKGTDMA